jgi:hypothetical protein
MKQLLSRSESVAWFVSRIQFLHKLFGILAREVTEGEQRFVKRCLSGTNCRLQKGCANGLRACEDARQWTCPWREILQLCWRHERDGK